MNRNRSSMMSPFAATLVLAGAGFGVCRTAGAQERPPDVQVGVEVLTRGPVHEAFAETVSFNPEPGTIVTKAPPPPIEEVPPDQRPEGANVTWIPGYWAWENERSDFLWVSGVWRAMPPGRSWVSGYWGRGAGGSQWMSGYWADSQVRETVYLPEPPDSVEVGPNMVSPSRDHIWAPGCWVWHEGRYAWRPGYWVVAHPDWIWVPSHYVYSPRGYVYCEGYWDHTVESRGVMYAPVYFEPTVYARSDFRYSPSIAINLSVFVDHLFVRPSCHHYYFGDYYAPRYYDEGIYASFSFRSSRYGYDPIHVNEAYRHRDDHDWDHRVRQTFLNRREHEEARPPQTLAIQVSLAAKPERAVDRSYVVAAPLAQVARSQDHPIQLQPVAKAEKKELVKRGQEIEKFRGERRNLEAAPQGKVIGKSPAKPDSNKQDNKPDNRTEKANNPTRPDTKPEVRPDKTIKPESKPDGRPDNANRPAMPDNTPDRTVSRLDKPDTAKLPKSPIVAKPINQLEKGKAPPMRPDPPKPDTKVEVKPKQSERGRPDPPQAAPKESPRETPKESPKDNPREDPSDKSKDKDKSKGKP